MKIRPCGATCYVLLLTLGLLHYSANAQNNRRNKYACSETNPARQCSASNTCGSSSAACMVDVKRTGYSASATPGIPNAKGNSLFCVRTGTTVTWQSTAKNTGFLIDFGPSSPFDPPDAIMGGSKRSASVTAARPGCFLYAFQATDSTGTYGMSQASQAELIVIGNK